ncbi:hypothetical protein GCM10022419_018640 [Nonomuraea rosea]|uniref:Uncharacterized protein n=1 Tax=Nonomuraea rosea TaxID=638574 RepID=A0ABP6VSY2_9ACTN
MGIKTGKMVLHAQGAKRGASGDAGKPHGPPPEDDAAAGGRGGGGGGAGGGLFAG